MVSLAGSVKLAVELDERIRNGRMAGWMDGGMNGWVQ